MSQKRKLQLYNINEENNEKFKNILSQKKQQQQQKRYKKQGFEFKNGNLNFHPIKKCQVIQLTKKQYKEDDFLDSDTETVIYKSDIEYYSDEEQDNDELDAMIDKYNRAKLQDSQIIYKNQYTFDTYSYSEEEYFYNYLNQKRNQRNQIMRSQSQNQSKRVRKIKKTNKQQQQPNKLLKAPNKCVPIKNKKINNNDVQLISSSSNKNVNSKIEEINSAFNNLNINENMDLEIAQQDKKPEHQIQNINSFDINDQGQEFQQNFDQLNQQTPITPQSSQDFKNQYFIGDPNNNVEYSSKNFQISQNIYTTYQQQRNSIKNPTIQTIEDCYNQYYLQECENYDSYQYDIICRSTYFYERIKSL